MAKLWAKVNGTWVSLGAQDKADVGLGNVENFGFTNSSTDGSSSKYATGAAVKEARDYIDSLATALSPTSGTTYLQTQESLTVSDETPRYRTLITAQRSGSCTLWLRQENDGNGYGTMALYKNNTRVAGGRYNLFDGGGRTISANLDFEPGDELRMYIYIDDNRGSTVTYTGRVYTGNSFI